MRGVRLCSSLFAQRGIARQRGRAYMAWHRPCRLENKRSSSLAIALGVMRAVRRKITSNGCARYIFHSGNNHAANMLHVASAGAMMTAACI